MPQLPRVTRLLLILFVGVSLLRVVSRLWVGLGDLATYAALVPELVWRGQLWRLVSYCWIALDPLELVFSGIFLFWVSRSLEQSWGGRLFSRRVLALIVLPAALTSLLSLLVGSLAGVSQLGISPLLLALVVAFATELKGQQIYMFPLPIPLSGDRILLFEGAMLALIVLFSGSIFQHMTSVFGFAVGLAWFRFDVVRDARRWLLRRRQASVERRIVQLKKERGLRVVRNEDDERDDESKYLH